jgi:hypothetical protein
MKMQMKRTTVRDYEADLKSAQAWFDERTRFIHSSASMEPEEYDQTWKTINDALNDEWQRGITIDAWVQRALDATNKRPVRR